MGLGKLIKKVGKAIAPKRLSIAGHKFSLNPADMVQGAASDVMQGKNAGDVWRGVDESRKANWRTGAAGAAVYGGAALAGAAGGAGGAAGAAGAGGMPGMSMLKAGIGGVPESVMGGAEDPSRFRSIASGLWDNKEGLMDLAGFAGDAYSGYKSGQREDEVYKRSADEFNRLAPLRARGMQGMLDNERPDLSSTFAQPEQRYRKVNVGSRI